MTGVPLYKLGASEVAALTRAGDLSVETYAKALIERVLERDPSVRGWAHFDSDTILASARALDAIPADKRGPLHGVAVGVKDVIYTKDMPTTHYSPIYQGSQPEIDAGVVLSLRASGALIFGKTHTTEFATCQTGPPTNNPHDLTRTPGGSSSGSGAVVGDFQVPISLGTQTGGSTIRPGSYNGILALKPTWNAVSREGLKMYSITCDTVGIYARATADLNLIAEVLRLHDDAPIPKAPFTVAGASFAFIRTPVWPKATPNLEKAWEQAKSILTDSGATVEEVELPEEFDNIAKWHADILHMEGNSSFLGDYLQNADRLDPWVLKQATNDKGTTKRELLDAYDGIARLRPLIDDIARKYSAIITPSVTDEAPVMEEPTRFTGDASFCLMWTVLHTPVLNVPGFVGPNGMPIGLSLVTARYEDRKLLHVGQAVATAFEQGGWKLSSR